MTDQSIENEIVAKVLTAPRITPADIEANINSEHYFTADQATSGFTPNMVDRFLRWRLPDDFQPDAGIRFNAPMGVDTVDTGSHYWPVGTNLLTANQAKEMLKFVVGDAPIAPALKLLTFCVLVLKNGFTVTGESACASPENFDVEIGRKIARQNAVNKIWPLMGYQLKEQLYQATVPSVSPEEHF